MKNKSDEKVKLSSKLMKKYYDFLEISDIMSKNNLYFAISLIREIEEEIGLYKEEI